VDYNDLLQPISSSSDVGSYLKNDRSAYRSLRNNFNAAQSSFRRLTETPDSSNDELLFEENQNNWQLVNQTCWETLTDNSKDIEIYCWWIMSLAFQDQAITKISSALATLVTFIETFWPNVHPCLPEDKLKSAEPSEQFAQRAELQLRPLIQLLGEGANSGLLFMPLQMMSLVNNIDHAQYFSATKAGTLPALKQVASKDFPIHQNDIAEVVTALDLAINALSKLDVWLQDTMKMLNISAISVTFLKTSLNDNLQAIKYLVGDLFTPWPLDKQADDRTPSLIDKTAIDDSSESKEAMGETLLSSNSQQSSQASNSSELTAHKFSSNNLANREHAFKELRIIADYFAVNEPHSPISFLLEKAIRWGHTPLPDLMLELIGGNDKALNQINLIAGLAEKKTKLSEVLPDVNKVINESTNIKDSFITKKSPKEVEASNSKSNANEQDSHQEKPPTTEDFTW
jgi:type VI secretion system protein ImpA